MPKRHRTYLQKYYLTCAEFFLTSSRSEAAMEKCIRFSVTLKRLSRQRNEASHFFAHDFEVLSDFFFVLT